MSKTFQEEKNELLQHMLDNSFYKIWHTPMKERSIREQTINLEIYITTTCNQNCEYCYLQKYEEQLYPKEIRNQEQILKNIEILLNYCIEQKFEFNFLDLYSGEIWHTPFGLKVLDIVLNKIDNGLNLRKIMIPSNLQFLVNDKATQDIENYIQAFKDKGISLIFSCSNDGMYSDNDSRELKNKNEIKYNEAFYDKMFKFCKKWNYGFHPMVSAHAIKNWPKNIQWWAMEMKKYGFNFINDIMLLEVRNDEWTKENIVEYFKYLNTIIELTLQTEQINGDLNIFKKFTANLKTDKKIRYHYQTVRPNVNKTGFHLSLTCGLPHCLGIRAGDLAIVPCHRTSYEQFIGGRYIVENDKIVGVQGENLQVLNQCWFNNLLGSPKCGTCPYQTQCAKGCVGAQFESTGDLFYPCESVCNLFKARVAFLWTKYSQWGILSYPEHEMFLDVIKQVKNDKEFIEWVEIAEKIIEEEQVKWNKK